MIRDFSRRPVNRFVAAMMTFGLVSVGLPAQAAGLKGVPQRQRPTSAPLQADPADTRINVFVELSQDAAITSYAGAMHQSLGAQAETGSSAMLDAAKLAGNAAGRRQLQAVQAQQDVVRPQLEALGARLIYRASKAINGFAVQVDASQVDAIRALPGVKRAFPMTLKEIGNSTSLPYLGVPAGLWDSLGGGVTGDGVSVGVIDTGIDYQHAMFGGTGLTADYSANNRTVITEVGAAAFPTSKVVGGWDFAGDDYNGSAPPNPLPSPLPPVQPWNPVPDPDPMDCNGHGSHVAGTAAGFGVTGAGAAYAGPYDAPADLGSLRIGPGAAPHALLYGLRVFGCKGSTALTAQAIDWAMDPNDDGNLSDHLDVINMSLGSSFGSMIDESLIASNNAAAAGVVVVASAGNSGDVYFITGAPAAGSGVTSVAAGTDLIPLITVTSGGLSGNQYGAAGAAFGPNGASFSGNTVLAQDGVAPASDGCTALNNTLSDVTGKIAVIDRGTCTFVVKVKNAQNAGAIGVIIANTAAGAFGTLGGSDVTITIPSVMVTFANGNTLKANLPLDSSVDQTDVGDTLASFSSRGPRRGWGFKPDVTAPGSNITSAQTGIVCTSDSVSAPLCTAPFDATGISAGSRPLSISGTSMAAPHVAGIMAALRELHPTWKPGELRSLLLTTSSYNVYTGINSTGAQYGPGRVGAGRVNVTAAAASQVVVGDDKDMASGVSWERLSQTFGTEILGAYSKTQTLVGKNFGASTATFDLSYVPVVDNPGINVDFPLGTTYSIPGGKKTAKLTFRVSSPGANALAKTRDASVAATQTSPFIGSLPREWQGEESGHIVLTPTSGGGQPTLRLPLHMAPKPSAQLTSSKKKYASPLTLAGTDFETSDPGLAIGAEVAAVTPLEWQADSPNEDQGSGDPLVERVLDDADIRHVGVGTDGSRIFFGVSTWGNWATPNEVEFRVYIDTNQDGAFEYRLFNANSIRALTTTFGNSAYTDSFLTIACSPGGSCFFEEFLNGWASSDISTQLFNNNVMVLPAYMGDIGATGPFDYWIEAYSREGGLVDTIGSSASPLTWDPTAPGLSFGPNFAPLHLPGAGATIPHTFDAANFAANGSLGVLLLHHHNAGPTKTAVGTRSEALPISNTVSIGDASVVEGNSGQWNLNFTLNLSSPAAAGTTVTVQTADGSATTADNDYVAKTQSFTFAAGTTTKTFTVKVKGDLNAECDETLGANITSTTGVAVSNGEALGTILTDDSCV